MTGDLQRASELIRVRRYADAAAEAVRYLAANPESVAGHELLALAQMELGDHPGATESARNAVRIDPERANSHYVLAFAQMRANQLAKAMASVVRALELDPERATLHDLRARLLFVRRKYRAALKAVEHALVLDPDDADHHATHVRVLRALRRHAEADASLARGLRIAPDNADLIALQGAAHLRRGAPAAAAEAFVAALRQDPSDEAARRGLLDALRSRSRVYRVVLQLRRGVAALTRGHSFWVLFLWMALCVGVVRLFVGNSALNVVRAALIAVLVMPTDVANLLLLLHPIGRHLLSRSSRVCAVIVALLLATALVLVVVAWQLDDSGLRIAAGACGASALVTCCVRWLLEHVPFSRPFRITTAILLVIAVVLVVIVIATR